MKICIDGLSLSHFYGTGYYSYTFDLLDKLLYAYPQPEYELIWNGSHGIPEWNNHNNLTYLELDMDRRNNNYTSLAEHLAQSKTDLYYSPNNGFSIPEEKQCKYMMTVHDLAPLSRTDLADEKYTNKMMSVFPNAVRKADSIIAVSEFIKSELIKYYHVQDKKIEVVYPGCSDIFRPIDLEIAKSVLKNRYKIIDKYILYAGSIHKRKNLEVIIKAFKSLSQESNSLKLILIGNYDSKRKEYYMQLKNLAEELEIQDKVIFLGRVDYFDMPYFYNCACCSVNLSEYDGFPISAVEASACNCPVICLRNTSFNELDLSTSIYIDKPEVQLLKNTIINVSSPSGKRNKPYNNKYKWDNSIKKIVQVIEATVYNN